MHLRRTGKCIILILAICGVVGAFQNCSKLASVDSLAASTSSGGGNPGDAPAAPSQLSLSVESSVQINLNWVNNSNNESGIVVERALAASGPFVTTEGSFTVVTTTAAGAVAYSDNELQPATTYYYRVIATNAAGQSAPCGQVSATTAPAPTTPPIAPSNLTATVSAATIINLSWDDNSNNEASFDVERSADNGVTFAPVASAGANSVAFQDYNLDPATAYVYRVRAVNSAGNSTYAANATATTLAAGNMATFSYISVNILNTNCVSCHGGNTVAAGVNLTTYNLVVGIVSAGDAANSTLYTAITTNMPPGAPMTATQIAAIKNWINAGALNN